MPILGSNRPTTAELANQEEEASRPRMSLADYELPPEGLVTIVLAEVYFYQEWKTPKEGEKYLANLMQFCFEIDALMTKGRNKGKRFILDHDRFGLPTQNLGPKSKTAKFFQEWEGSAKALTKEQLGEWIEAIENGSLIGQCALGNIVHGESATGNGFAKFESVKSLDTGKGLFKPITLSADYVPKTERIKRYQGVQNADTSFPTDDAPVPTQAAKGKPGF